MVDPYDYVWPICDPYLILVWPIYDHGWPIYDPWLTHTWVTWPIRPMYDPWLTHTWPMWHIYDHGWSYMVSHGSHDHVLYGSTLIMHESYMGWSCMSHTWSCNHVSMVMYGQPWLIHGSFWSCMVNLWSYMCEPWLIWGSYMGHVWVIHGSYWSCIGNTWSYIGHITYIRVMQVRYGSYWSCKHRTWVILVVYVSIMGLWSAMGQYVWTMGHIRVIYGHLGQPWDIGQVNLGQVSGYWILYDQPEVENPRWQLPMRNMGCVRFVMRIVIQITSELHQKTNAKWRTASKWAWL